MSDMLKDSLDSPANKVSVLDSEDFKAKDMAVIAKDPLEFNVDMVAMVDTEAKVPLKFIVDKVASVDSEAMVAMVPLEFSVAMVVATVDTEAMVAMVEAASVT